MLMLRQRLNLSVKKPKKEFWAIGNINYAYLSEMTFELVVTISMDFYERCQAKRDV